MKKLIYIANARIPTEKAHGIQIMKMCESFALCDANDTNLHANATNKIEVELVIPRRFNPIKQDPFDYYGVQRNFKITKLSTLDLITLGLGQFGFFIETILFLISSAIYLFFKKYDILYTREALTGLFLKNIVLEIHSLPTSEARPPNFLQQKIWKRAKVLLVLTSFIKVELIELGINENKILVLPDAVDFQKFDIKISKDEARKKLGLPHDRKIVLYTGSFYLYDWKGVDLLLEAASNFQFLISNFQPLFILVGGSEKEIEEIKNKFKTENVLLVGHKPHAEIPYYLKAADVLVLPNKKGHKMSEEHTSPLKLFEYMASARPIVSSDLPSLREILTEKEAIFFKPNDPADLARAIKEILKNSALAEQLAHNAREKSKNFTWSKRAQRAIEFL